jgi:hypothetical protein
METAQVIFVLICASVFAYFALKEGLSKETDEKKFYNIINPPTGRFSSNFWKWYGVVIGAILLLIVIYSAFYLLFKMFF